MRLLVHNDNIDMWQYYGQWKCELKGGNYDYIYLFHTMAYFYVIYRYVISEWRSISMTSQWPLIMTSQWVMTLLGMNIVKSQWGISLFTH